MGIKGLTKLISEQAPDAMKESALESFVGRKVAFDASMHIYQFLAVVGRSGDQVLTNEAGEVTAHLQGLFHRTIRIVEAGIKPIFVFDGKPPELKSAEIAERREKREEADKALAAAKEAGDAAEVEKLSKRTIKVTKDQNEDCKKLLRLMGIPVLEAPSEAEAQCAELCKKGAVYAVGSEDMDTLTFGTAKLARHLMEPESRKMPVVEFDLQKVLSGLELSMESFIDLCILCGCDYCDNIKGIGPTTALKLIREHKTLEKVMELIRESDKYSVPSNFPYMESKAFFEKPEVTDAAAVDEIKLGTVDVEGTINFLVHEKTFAEERVVRGLERLKKAAKAGMQSRMDSFFKPTGGGSFAPLKRKNDDAKKGGAASSKKAKGLVTKGKSKGVGKR